MAANSSSMRLRLVLAAATASMLSVLAPGAQAAPTTVTDKTGDANAINDQGVCFAPPACVPNDTATPGSQPAFDIATLTLSSTFTGKGKTRTPKALVVTLSYVGKPDETSTVHRVTAADAGGCATFLLQYYAQPSGNQSALRTCSDGSDPTVLIYDVPLPMPKITENAIIWTIPYPVLKSLPSPLRPGAVLSGLGAHNRLAHAATAPVIDNVASELSYKLGS